MNRSSPKPGKYNREGEFDALVVPSAETGDQGLDVTFFDQRIPFFDIDPDQPAESSPLPTRDDTPVSFELMPDFTLDRSQRHFEVAPPLFTKDSSEAEVHLPVFVTAPTPAAALPANDPIIDNTKAPAHADETFSIGTLHDFRSTAPPAPSTVPNCPTDDNSNFSSHPHINKSASGKDVQPPPFYPFSPGIAANAVPDSSPDPEALETAITKLVHSIPLLNEEDMLETLAEPEHGGFAISPKTLKQALGRLGLETDYKRYRAYITG